MKEQKEPKQKPTKARVLLDCTIDGKQYLANAVISADAGVIRDAEKDGKVDSHPSAVAQAEG